MDSNSKRIAKNTVYLYIRMLFLALITLFTSRVLLDKLGIEDFGIYNVVGGVTVMFAFFQSSLASASQRFLNIELGLDNLSGANHVFCQHFTLYVLIALAVFIVGETFGLWFVRHKLTISPDRLPAALWAYQFALLSLCSVLLGIVFNSAIIAHEQMGVYSYIGIFEGCSRLAVAYLISVSPIDRLISYAFLLFCFSLVVQLMYYFYCRKKYVECRLHFVWDKPLLKKTFSIVGYNGLGTAVYAINDQGINVLLNIFFGPVVNAARAVSFQISNAVSNFTRNFYTAVTPQITKSYAKGDMGYLMSLFYKSSKLAFFLFWALCVPIALCIDRILALWLKQVPTYTNIFTLWIFGYALINVLNNPILTIALAVGRLRNYMLIGSAVFLMVFPLSYISLKFGYSPVSVFVILFGVRLCYLFVVLRILKGYIDYRIRDYLKKVILPILQVAVLSLLINFVLRSVIPDTLAWMFVFIVLSLVVTGACVWGLGLSAEERRSFLSVIKQKLVRL